MANTFKNAATGSNTTINPFYTCPAATSGVVHAIYVSNIDGTNDATINVTISGSANFTTRRHIMKTVNVPADSTGTLQSNAMKSLTSKSCLVASISSASVKLPCSTSTEGQC